MQRSAGTGFVIIVVSKPDDHEVARACCCIFSHPGRELGGIAFPHARLAIRIHRRRKQTGKRESRESVYAVTSLDTHQAGPAELAAAVRS